MTSVLKSQWLAPGSWLARSRVRPTALIININTNIIYDNNNNNNNIIIVNDNNSNTSSNHDNNTNNSNNQCRWFAFRFVDSKSRTPARSAASTHSHVASSTLPQYS